jgi:hypothetical protein
MTKARERGLIIQLERINSNRPVDYILLEYDEENNIDLVGTDLEDSSLAASCLAFLLTFTVQYCS